MAVYQQKQLKKITVPSEALITYDGLKDLSFELVDQKEIPFLLHSKNHSIYACGHFSHKEHRSINGILYTGDTVLTVRLETKIEVISTDATPLRGLSQFTLVKSNLNHKHADVLTSFNFSSVDFNTVGATGIRSRLTRTLLSPSDFIYLYVDSNAAKVKLTYFELELCS